ncbi:MAG: AraC family transcriptional regulator [Clostridiales bacterium]|nr:AraC family transcriptional regulator [Clostridiales bacterium]
MGIKSSITMDFGEKSQDDFSVSFQKCANSMTKSWPPHWHNCFELIYLTEGKRAVTINGALLFLHPGDIAVLPPHVIHSTDIPGIQTFQSIIFGYTEPIIYTPDISFSNMKYLTPFRHTRTPEKYILSGESEKLCSLRRLISSAAEEIQHRSVVRELIVRSRILEIHSLIYELFLYDSKSSETSSEYLLDIQIYIENHLREDISPYDIAEALHISYSHMSRLVRSALGTTVSELICRMRMSLAEQLLISNPELNITECALTVGFNNASYFIKQFRRIKGVSPGSFRQLLKDDISFSNAH